MNLEDFLKQLIKQLNIKEVENIKLKEQVKHMTEQKAASDIVISEDKKQIKAFS